jgi:hypothetical protein
MEMREIKFSFMGMKNCHIFRALYNFFVKGLVNQNWEPLALCGTSYKETMI